MPAVVDPRPAPAFAAFAARDFRFYLAARFLATTSIQMVAVAVGFQVYTLTRRPLDLGYVGLAEFLPIAALSLVAGQLADRVDRRAVLFVCDLLFGVCAAVLWVLARSPAPSVVPIFAVLVVLGAGRAFYGPSGSALLPSLVPREHLANAIAWQSALWQLAAIGGPSLGGVIYAIGAGPGPVYVVATIGFGVGGVLLAGIAPRPIVRGAHEAPATIRLFDGLRYVLGHRVLLGTLTLDFFAVFLGGATALLPVYAAEVLHVGVRSLGLMRAAPAIGAALTAGWLTARPLGRNAGRKMLIGVAVFGAATIVFGVSRSLPLTIGALIVLGAADMVSAVVRATLVQAATPPAMRGRVSAVNLIFIGASNELGEFESGTLASFIGAVPCVVVGGVGTLLVVLLAAWTFPQIRGVDRLEDVTPPT